MITCFLSEKYFLFQHSFRVLGLFLQICESSENVSYLVYNSFAEESNKNFVRGLSNVSSCGGRTFCVFQKIG